MDQKKQGQQSEGFKSQQQGTQPPQQGSQPPSGERKWQEPTTPNPTREPAEDPRHMPGGEKKGGDFEKGSDFQKGTDRSGGSTYRDLDREMDEQEELPDRGSSQSDQSDR